MHPLLFDFLSFRFILFIERPGKNKKPLGKIVWRRSRLRRLFSHCPVSLVLSAAVSMASAAEVPENREAESERTAPIQSAPPEAYEEGSELPYFGSQDPWDRRFFRERRGDSRGGQRHILDIQEGRVDEVISFCEVLLDEVPASLEARFALVAAYCQRARLDDAVSVMNEALGLGMPFTRFMAGPRKLLAPLYETDAFQSQLDEYGSLLVHGPLLGDVTATSARFWVRTFGAAEVQIAASRDSSLRSPLRSEKVHTSAARDYTAVLSIEGLKPGRTYYYNIVINNNPEKPHPDWKFKSFPVGGTSGKYQVGFGGCAMYTPENERMWDTIAGRHLDAFLLLGDNMYIDLPQQVSPLHDYTYYRRQSRPEFRRLSGGTPIYAIWDDHDCAMDDLFFGPFVDRPAWKPSMWELFRRNWANPGYGSEPEFPGCWFRFSIGDIDFFMLDGRYYRENFLLPEASMLGPVQKAWLFEGLRASEATFRVLVSPVAWALDAKPYSKTGGPHDTWYGYQEERSEIFQYLKDEGIEGVILLSSDRHRSDVRVNTREGAYPLYEFESGRLTNAGHHPHAGETIFSYNEKCSFGILAFDTETDVPEVTLRLTNIDDDEVYSLTLRRDQLE